MRQAHNPLGSGQPQGHGKHRVADVLLAGPVLREVPRRDNEVCLSQQNLEPSAEPLGLDKHRDVCGARRVCHHRGRFGETAVKVGERRASEQAAGELIGDVLGPQASAGGVDARARAPCA